MYYPANQNTLSATPLRRLRTEPQSRRVQVNTVVVVVPGRQQSSYGAVRSGSPIYVWGTRLRAVHEEHRRRYPPIRFVCRMKPATSSLAILFVPAVDEMGDDHKQPSLGFFPLLSSAFRSGDTEKNYLFKLLIFGIHPESRVVANTLCRSHRCGSGDHGWSALFPVVCKEREIELVNGTESKDPRNFFRKWFRPIDWQKRSTERPQAPGTTGTPVTFSLAKCSENICSANCLTHNERTLQSPPPAHNHFLRRPPNSSDHTPNPTLLSDHLQLLVPLQQQTEQVLPGENSNRSGNER